MSLCDPDALAQMSNEVETLLKTLKKSSKVKTIKHKANKDNMPKTATYNSSVEEVDLSEESVYQVSKNIIVLSPKHNTLTFIEFLEPFEIIVTSQYLEFHLIFST